MRNENFTQTLDPQKFQSVKNTFTNNGNNSQIMRFLEYDLYDYQNETQI